MSLPSITAPPVSPSPSDGAAFGTRAYAFLSWMYTTFGTEIAAWVAAVNAIGPDAALATLKAAEAKASADAAAYSAGNNVRGIAAEMAPSNADLGTAARLDQTWYEASVAWDATSIAQAAQSSTTVAVPGAEIGDYVLSSCSISTSGLALQAQVTAQDVVTVYLRNLTGSPVDLASATYYVRVMARQPRR